MRCPERPRGPRTPREAPGRSRGLQEAAACSKWPQEAPASPRGANTAQEATRRLVGLTTTLHELFLAVAFGRSSQEEISRC